MKRNAERKNRIILLVLFLLIGCVFLAYGRPTTVAKAYTEEQKQEAKAWLSAHGYPATKEGAYQAYRDYLSGKLTLSEEDQKRINQSLGQSSKKKKNSTEKKKQEKSPKNKKSVDKKKEASATPRTKRSDNEKEEVQKQQSASPASPSPGAKKMENRTETSEDKSTDKSTGISKGYLWGGVCLLVLLAGIIALYIRKRKSIG